MFEYKTNKVIIFQKPRLDSNLPGGMTDNITKRLQSFSYHQNLYSDMPDSELSGLAGTYSMAAKLGLRMPNLAPEVDTFTPTLPPVMPAAPPVFNMDTDAAKEPKKKKYAKEAWPGKRPTGSLLV